MVYRHISPVNVTPQINKAPLSARTNFGWSTVLCLRLYLLPIVKYLFETDLRDRVCLFFFSIVHFSSRHCLVLLSLIEGLCCSSSVAIVAFSCLPAKGQVFQASSTNLWCLRVTKVGMYWRTSFNAEKLIFCYFEYSSDPSERDFWIINYPQNYCI